MRTEFSDPHKKAETSNTTLAAELESIVHENLAKSEGLPEVDRTGIIEACHGLYDHFDQSDIGALSDSSYDYMEQARSIFNYAAKQGPDSHELSSAYLEANLLFVHTYLDEVKFRSQSQSPDEVAMFVRKFSKTFLSSSPSIISYAGNDRDKIELFSKSADIPELHDTLLSNLQGELIYRYSFDTDPETIIEVLRDQPTKVTFDGITLLRNIALSAPDEGDWAEKSSFSIMTALSEPDYLSSPLSKIYATSVAQEIQDDMATEWVDLDELPEDEQLRVLADDVIRKNARAELRQRDQELYGDLLATLPKGATVRTVASDAIGISYGNLPLYRVAMGEPGTKFTAETDLVEPEAIAAQIRARTMSPEALGRLFQSFETPALRGAIEVDLGINFETISLKAQLQLVDFMSKGSTDLYDDLKDTITRDPEHSVIFLESFLALEHGDEFGEILVNLAEKMKPAEFQMLNQEIAAIRENIGKLVEFVSEADEVIGSGLEHAAILRVTELLAVAEALSGLDAENGPEVTLYNGEIIQSKNISEVLTALRNLNSGFIELGSAFDRQSWETVRYGEGAEYSTSGRVAVQLRSGGVSSEVRDPRYEFDGEARVNFLVNLELDELIPGDISDLRRQRALSIRLDRECILRGPDGVFLGSDPTRPDGEVSLDIGSIYGAADNPNVQLGRCLAIGNALIAKKRGLAPNFNHIREVFNLRLGQSEAFSVFVAAVQSQLGAKGLPGASSQTLAA